MESYLQITQINDFIFCPRSVFFSGIYHNSTDDSMFNQTPQVIGKTEHQTIDNGTYSSRSDVLMGIMVYSEKYNLLGRIDVFDCSSGMLTERKYSVTAVYDGFRYQLYAQYFALQEIGYNVRSMRLHSKKDNRNYPVDLPDEKQTAEFEAILDKIRSYRLDMPHHPNPNKCAHCIYNCLCDYYQE